MVKKAKAHPTIKQVAEAAGVSTQTVSRVVNNRPDVAMETRQRVLDIIRQLDYRPNVLARSLIRRRSHTLGVVTAGLDYTGPSRTLNGITARAEELGYALLLMELRDFGMSEIQPIVRRLNASQVDGIIWAVAETSGNRDEFERLLPELPAPILFLTMAGRTGWHSVSIDNYLGGRLATEHLLSVGHRQIAHLSGPQTWWEARERWRGWGDALTEAGIDESAQVWAEGDWSSASGRRVVQQLLLSPSQPTAFFVGNDQMALGVLQFAHQAGLRIPQDLAVVGFDDIPESAYFWPSLTTIHQDLHELGCRAVSEITRIIEEGLVSGLMPEPAAMWLKPRLVVRSSSGA